MRAICWTLNLAIVASIAWKTRAVVARVTWKPSSDSASAAILAWLHPTNAVCAVAQSAIVSSAADWYTIGVAIVSGCEIGAVWLIAHRAMQG